MRGLFLSWLIILVFGPATAKASTWRGDFTISDSQFSVPPPNPTANNIGSTILDVTGRGSTHGLYGSKLSWQLHPIFRANSDTGTPGDQTSVDPREALLELSGQAIKLKVGYLSPVWDGTDGVNPMDVASSKDYRNPVAATTQGSFAVAPAVIWLNSTFELYYIPLPTPARLPGAGSPWWPRDGLLPLQGSAQTLQIQSGLQYQILNNDILDHALNDNWGARYVIRSEVLDFSLGYFDGQATLPALVPTLNVTPLGLNSQGQPTGFLLTSPVIVGPVYYRRHVTCGALTVPVGSWIFRLSGQYDAPTSTDSRVPWVSNQTVAEIEKSFSISGKLVSFVLANASTRRANTGNIVTSSDLFERAWLGGLRASISDTILLNMSGFYDYAQYNSQWHTELEKSFWDRFKISAAFTNLQGPAGTLLGTLKNRSYGELRATVLF